MKFPNTFATSVLEVDSCQEFLASQLPIAPSSFTHFPHADIHQTIQRCFESVVERHPDQVAVKTPEQTLTYRELNEKGNQVAHAVVERCGTLPQQVAFLLPNDGSALPVLLGILKAGKSYVPLDPLFPRDRLAYMLEDSTAQVILTDEANEALARSLGPECVVINVDNISPVRAVENLDLDIDPLSVAYILYTSGSTGQPKGIAFCHRNLLHTTMCLINSLRFSPTDSLTQMHSTSFASSIVDIYCCLLTGGTLYPWDVKERGFIGLADWLRREKVTSLQWIPTPFRHFMEALEEDVKFPDVRLVVMASEPLTTKEVKLHRRHFGADSLLVNQMGTSESHNYHLYFVSHETQVDSYIVPAGYSVSEDRTALILDENHAPVKPGEPGEIAICSPYMALGYWNRDALTTEKFLPGPTGQAGGIYLTGDLGRVREDGCLIHLGRKDFQVKIRGYRIETTEVEKTLHEAPGVRDAVVVAQSTEAGDTQLVAFIIPEQFNTISVADVKEYLAERLPQYMVPADFVQLDSFPTTVTGKLDRKRLPQVSQRSPQSATAKFAPPQTPSETLLFELWARVLGTQSFGTEDNWFELGGHSLTAARLFLEIEKRTGKRLPMSTLFQHQTIGEQARLIDSDMDSISWSSLVPIQPNGSRPPLFLIHAHGGSVLGYHELAHYFDSDQPVYGLQAQGLDGVSFQERSMAEMATAYLEEIRTVQPRGPYHLAGFCFGGNVAYEMAQQLRKAGEKVAFLAMIETSHPAYPRYLSHISRRQRITHKILDRCKFEWDYGVQNGDERIRSFIFSRMEKIFSVAQVKIEEKLSRVATPFHLTIPHSQRYKQARLEAVHDRAYYGQHPEVYPGDVLLFIASNQPSGIQSDPTLGWGDLIEGALTIHEVEGYRVGILDEPRVQQVAEILKMKLEEALLHLNEIDGSSSSEGDPSSSMTALETTQ